MFRISNLLSFLETIAPKAGALPGDTIGLLVGRNDAPVSGVIVTLDITKDAIAAAKHHSANVIVSHHPTHMGAFPRPTDSTIAGELLLTLAEERIAAIAAHTNLDCAADGVNDALARAIGLQNIAPLCAENNLGRVGDLPAPMTSASFAAFCKTTLAAPGVRFCAGTHPVTRVAVCGGSGGDLLAETAAVGADTLLTGEVRHHQFLEARARGLTLLDAGHAATESVVLDRLATALRDMTPVWVNDEQIADHR